MKLTLCSSEETVSIDIQTNQFAMLRSPRISDEEINLIAQECGVDSRLLSVYVEDLKKSAKEMIEIDGSCDYSDHL